MAILPQNRLPETLSWQEPESGRRVPSGTLTIKTADEFMDLDLEQVESSARRPGDAGVQAGPSGLLDRGRPSRSQDIAASSPRARRRHPSGTRRAGHRRPPPPATVQIDVALPFTASPTRFHPACGTARNALRAADGRSRISPMIEQAVQITSRCHHSHEPVESQRPEWPRTGSPGVML